MIVLFSELTGFPVKVHINYGQISGNIAGNFWKGEFWGSRVFLEQKAILNSILNKISFEGKWSSPLLTPLKGIFKLVNYATFCFHEFMICNFYLFNHISTERQLPYLFANSSVWIWNDLVFLPPKDKFW